jgi:transcriptional regulator with XRE-family HTH domain
MGIGHKRQSGLSADFVLAKALINVQIHLGLTQKELSDIIHTSPATVCRLAKGLEMNPDSAEGQFAMSFIRLYRSLSTLFGGQDELARAWLLSDNAYFESKPIDLIKSIDGLSQVLIYLDAMRGLA